MLEKLKLWYRMFYLLPKENWFVWFKSSRHIIFTNGKFDDIAFVINLFILISFLAWNEYSLKTK